MKEWIKSLLPVVAFFGFVFLGSTMTDEVVWGEGGAVWLSIGLFLLVSAIVILVYHAEDTGKRFIVIGLATAVIVLEVILAFIENSILTYVAGATVACGIMYSLFLGASQIHGIFASDEMDDGDGSGGGIDGGGFDGGGFGGGGGDS
jgi:uncharacterized membrane protein YgcG